MKIYTFKNQQKLPINIDTAWEFLCNPNNLEKLTPAKMQMKLLSKITKPMYPGQILKHRVTLFPGIKTTWVSEIRQYKHKDYFVDVQLFGPYALWHHKHFVKEIDGGVITEDVIDYKVPFGILGQLLHPIIVKPKLEAIFNYRTSQMEAMFGSYNAM